MEEVPVNFQYIEAASGPGSLAFGDARFENFGHPRSCCRQDIVKVLSEKAGVRI
jgi:hypothetical protein